MDELPSTPSEQEFEALHILKSKQQLETPRKDDEKAMTKNTLLNSVHLMTVHSDQIHKVAKKQNWENGMIGKIKIMRQ